MAVAVLPEDIVLRSVGARYYTAVDWEQMPDDGWVYEVINGELWMSSSPRHFHQYIQTEIIVALHTQLKTTGVAFVTGSPTGVFMPGCDPVQPDVVVLRQEDRDLVDHGLVRGVPALLVEILSRGNARRDTETKREVYALAGVPEYWIVRPKERDILVHTLPDSETGLYLRVTHIPPDGELVSPTLPFRATILDFFAGAPDTTL